MAMEVPKCRQPCGAHQSCDEGVQDDCGLPIGLVASVRSSGKLLSLVRVRLMGLLPEGAGGMWCLRHQGSRPLPCRTSPYAQRPPSRTAVVPSCLMDDRPLPPLPNRLCVDRVMAIGIEP